ncbi:hypothetical protein [Moorena producens]|uniref:hypothetical protein n=1 Tax=Moorena producens TaxID=1155739 RepID=UPI0013146367|nr:hypothetical protein [Moorena producens]
MPLASCLLPLPCSLLPAPCSLKPRDLYLMGIRLAINAYEKAFLPEDDERI